MSWDVLIMNFSSPPPPVDELPKDFIPEPLGEANIVRDKITQSIPSVDWSDKSWGYLSTEKFSIEINFQENGIVEAFTLHIRGGGDPIPIICKICQDHGWFALDISIGDFINCDNPSDKGWKDFQAYRDRVLKTSGGNKEG